MLKEKNNIKNEKRENLTKLLKNGQKIKFKHRYKKEAEEEFKRNTIGHLSEMRYQKESTPYLDNSDVINSIYGKLRNKKDKREKLGRGDAKDEYRKKNVFMIGKPVKIERMNLNQTLRTSNRQFLNRKSQSADASRRYRVKEHKNIRAKGEARPNSVKVKGEDEDQSNMNGLQVKGVNKKKPFMGFKVKRKKKDNLIRPRK